MSEQVYYSGSDHGSYQYLTLETLINDFKAINADNSYVGNVPRYSVLYQAKRALRELTFDVLRDIRAIELSVGTNLQVTLPPDYVDYIRISWVDGDGNMYPMAVNNSLSIGKVYLQDNDYNLLFDGSGNVLEAARRRQSILPEDQVRDYTVQTAQFIPNVNQAGTFDWGSYRVDERLGVIVFDSEVYTREVVLEYLSDGLYFDTVKGETEADIKIHKFAETALHDFVYYSLVKNKAGVPMNEKARARKEHFNSKKRARRRLNGANRDEWLQVMRGADAWIKGKHNSVF